MMILKAVTLILAMLEVAECYKFLVIFPIPARSHLNLGDALVRELLKHGHEVTYATPFPTKKPTKGLTELDFTHILIEWQEETKELTPKMLTSGNMDVSFVKELARNVTYKFLRDDALQEVLLDKNKQFDAVIAEWFFTEILNTLSSVLNTHFIMFSTVGMHANMEYIMDEVASPGMQPSLFTGYSSPMTFYERLANTAITFLMIGSTIIYDHPAEAHVYKDILGPVAAARGIPLPDYFEVIHNASILLTNSHPSLTAATKLPPNVIEIGGFHVDDAPSPLTPKLQKIMDESKHGVIYFSLGSNLKSTDLGPEMRDTILNIFKGLKETVLWKFEADIPNLPPNVHIEKWMPQQSVLAHPQLKIFITHGGLLSTTEAIHHGIPLIGIPFFGDQHLNMAKSTKRGYALQVLLQDPKFAEILTGHIKEMLSNPKYGAKAKELSKLYHDRPVKPKDLAVYWVEYVVRTGGALHLRSLALSVPWYQRYLLDIFALFAAVLLVVIYTVKYVVKKVFGKKKKSKKE